MKSFKVEKNKSVEEIVAVVLAPSIEEIIHIFEVAPLDLRIKDYTTPKVVLTKSKLLVIYDELVELYSLSELEVEVKGNPPAFTLWQLFLLGKYGYGSEEDIRLMRQDENLTRLAISERGSVSKEFVLRQGLNMQEGFKTWAMSRMILDTKLNNSLNPVFGQMLEGYFSSFNQKTVLTFIGGFLGYFVLKVISLRFMPDLINTILDVLLSIGLILMLVWLYLSISNNLQKFERVYVSYN